MLKQPVVLVGFLFLTMTAGSGISSAAPARYALDPLNSSVRFEAESTAHAFEGEAATLSGEMTWDEVARTIGEGAIVRVPISGLSTHVAKRDNSMRKMFESKAYPEIEFRAVSATTVSPAADGAARFRLEGALKIRGIEKPIVIEVTARELPDGLEVAGETEVLTNWFELKPPSVFGLVKVLPEVKVRSKGVWKKV